jgi:CRISPR-associated protein Cas1
MQLVLDTHEIVLRQKNKSFLVTSASQKRLISPHRVTSIAVLGRCTITSSAILLAVEHKIPIIFFDETGDPRAQVWSANFGNQAELQRAQVVYGMSDQVPRWASELFKIKIQGQLKNLQWATDKYAVHADPLVYDRINEILEKIAAYTPSENISEALNWLMGMEGIAANYYWGSWGQMAPPGFKFDLRSRRPAKDMYNAALNYFYGMMYNTVESAAIAASLDPMLGVVHADQHGDTTLCFDLIEPFRPFVDRLLMELFYESQLDSRHFEIRESNAVWVSQGGRRLLIPAYNEWLQKKTEFNEQGETNMRNHIYIFVSLFANTLKTFWNNADFGLLRHRKRQPSDEISQ